MSNDGFGCTVPRVVITPGAKANRDRRPFELNFFRKYILQPLRLRVRTRADFGEEICSFRGAQIDEGGALAGALLSQIDLYLQCQLPAGFRFTTVHRTVTRSLPTQVYPEIFLSTYLSGGADVEEARRALGLVPPLTDRYHALPGWRLQEATAFDFLHELQSQSLARAVVLSRVDCIERGLRAEDVLRGITGKMEARALDQVAMWYVERQGFGQTPSPHMAGDSLVLLHVKPGEQILVDLGQDQTELAEVGEELKRTFATLGKRTDLEKVFKGNFRPSKPPPSGMDTEGFTIVGPPRGPDIIVEHPPRAATEVTRYTSGAGDRTVDRPVRIDGAIAHMTRQYEA